MVSRRSSAQQVPGTRSRIGRWLTIALIGVAASTGPMLIAPAASAANINSSTFSPAFAKNGTVLTLTVNTSNDIDCVKVVNAFGARTKAPAPFTFTYTAGAGDGVQTSTITAYKGNSTCSSGTTVADSASFTLDNTAPLINATRVPVANANGWNNTSVAVNFTCSDLNAVTSCGPNATVSTQGANQSVTGTAVDAAGNTASTTVSAINVDVTAPTLTGLPTTAANANGWYNSNVSINWTCTDALSGFANGSTCPGNSTITGEGSNLAATATVADKAGNSTTTTTSTVRIDRTAPVTVASAPPAWNNTNLTVALTATDALSGVANTQYSVDGGATQTGTSVLFDTDGDHVLQ